jgi:hypothetical protein
MKLKKKKHNRDDQEDNDGKKKKMKKMDFTKDEIIALSPHQVIF